MKNFFVIIVASMFLYACGEQSSKGDVVDTTSMERPDSESIVSMAQVMAEDLARFLHEDDIQSAAALCEEGLDNLMYFRETGDDVSADIYASTLHVFVRKNYEAMEDMATQNYLVKQFMTAVGDSAILNAKRRRYPQEEEIRREPTIEADGPAPTRPAVRHRMAQDDPELDTEGADYATDKQVEAAKKARAAERKQVEKKQVARQQTVKKQQKPAATARPVTAKTTPAATKKNQSAQGKMQANAANGKKKAAGQHDNVKKDNTKQKKTKGPILVECKKKTTNNGGKTSGEATSSQWFLVRPLD